MGTVAYEKHQAKGPLHKLSRRLPGKVQIPFDELKNVVKDSRAATARER